jgi:hypothetical protein
VAIVPASELPGADLCEVVDVALRNEGHLLTAGETLVARAILALGTAGADPVARDALELYARLTLRKGDVFFLRDLTYGFDVMSAAARLVRSGLAWDRSGGRALLEAADVSRLRAACARLGLPARGGRALVEERLLAVAWCDEPVIAVRHRRLLRRIERLCFGRAGVDRSVHVLERLGTVRWAEYTPTGGAGVHASRGAMLLWERARAGRWRDPAEPLEVALAGPAAFASAGDPARRCAPTGLSPWRYAVEAVVAGEPDPAVLERLRALGARVDVPLARALEREGRAHDALRLCVSVVEEGRRSGPNEDTVALARTGRRLARSLGVGWRTAALREPSRRVLRLPAGPRVGARPGWIVDGVRTVENAVLALPALRARGAIHAENGLWTTVFALVFAELYWLPVPGALPTARRYGPLDLGTPAFAERRADAVARRLAEVEEVGVVPFADAWSGERLAGLDARMVAAAREVPGRVARVVLERLCREGWRAAKGLPDLWIPAGEAQRIDEGLPARLGPEAVLVELKGPGDALQDAQVAWVDRLAERDISVELWDVRMAI